MKHLIYLVCAIGLIVPVMAQTSLSITTGKTTSLIFPFPVNHVDRGTKEVLVQIVPENKNILLVKAATKNFVSTNLSVITEDGSLYGFTVDYKDDLENWIYYLPERNKVSTATYAAHIIDNPQTMHGIKDKRWDMNAIVSGIYIKDNTIYYQIKLDNHSTIDYDIDFLRFYIRDKKKARRTAIQENEMTPLHVSGNTKLVRAASSSVIVVALQKFTIPDAKFLAIEINEKNGGRNLLLKVGNRKIIKATPLPGIN